MVENINFVLEGTNVEIAEENVTIVKVVLHEDNYFYTNGLMDIIGVEFKYSLRTEKTEKTEDTPENVSFCLASLLFEDVLRAIKNNIVTIEYDKGFFLEGFGDLKFIKSTGVNEEDLCEIVIC